MTAFSKADVQNARIDGEILQLVRSTAEAYQQMTAR